MNECLVVTQQNIYTDDYHLQQKLLDLINMQENEYKSHLILISHLSPTQVLPTHLNVYILLSEML